MFVRTTNIQGKESTSVTYRYLATTITAIFGKDFVYYCCLRHDRISNSSYYTVHDMGGIRRVRCQERYKAVLVLFNAAGQTQRIAPESIAIKVHTPAPYLNHLAALPVN